MAYFTYAPNSLRYPDEWENLLRYIKSEWPQKEASDLGELEFHIEAKALYIITMSRHLMDGAENLAKNRDWSRVFVEASMLLFPMLELVGQARLGYEQPRCSLGGGIDWLIDPEGFHGCRQENDMRTSNDRIHTLGRFMNTLPSGPKVKELFHMRNYLVHGLKNQHDANFDIGAVRTSMNWELPYAIIEQSKVAIAIYWRQLRNESGNYSREWVTRLAEADIYPFGIMGSRFYEYGLIDPDIICWLVNIIPTQAG